jgi:hypothetical protein
MEVIMRESYHKDRGGRRIYLYVFVVSGALMGGIVAGMIMLLQFINGADASPVPRDLDKLYEELGKAEEQRYDPKPNVVRVVMPSVVSITVEKRGGQRRRFSSGSGFIIRKDGYIILRQRLHNQERRLHNYQQPCNREAQGDFCDAARQALVSRQGPRG